jgi:alanine racemase
MLTWLKIDAEAIKYNAKQFKKLIGPTVLLMPVIKANAYGHGFLKVAKILHEIKEVDRICVVNLDEAVELIKNKLTKKPIMILSFFDNQDTEKINFAIKNNIIFPLYDLKNAQVLGRAGERLQKKIKVHLKIDTGASRLGILPKDALDFVKALQKLKHLEIEGLWSHFASSESDRNYTKTQYKTLKSVDENLQNNGFNIQIKHIACSSAILNTKFTHENAVRLGLSLYGLYPNKKRTIKLKPALSWYTTIIQTKNLPKGTKVGYGATFMTTKPTMIAILAIGYWDGYDRRLSNNGYVLINTKFCKILGRVCMNICMVDVTGLKVKAGDRVTLVGQNGKHAISIDDLAQWCQTINYEIVDRINPTLPRL